MVSDRGLDVSVEIFAILPYFFKHPAGASMQINIKFNSYSQLFTDLPFNRIGHLPTLQSHHLNFASIGSGWPFFQVWHNDYETPRIIIEWSI